MFEKRITFESCFLREIRSNGIRMVDTVVQETLLKRSGDGIRCFNASILNEASVMEGMKLSLIHH